MAAVANFAVPAAVEYEVRADVVDRVSETRRFFAPPASCSAKGCCSQQSAGGVHAAGLRIVQTQAVYSSTGKHAAVGSVVVATTWCWWRS